MMMVLTQKTYSNFRIAIYITSIYSICLIYAYVFFFKQKTAYEMRISDWSSDVCSSDLAIDPNEMMIEAFEYPIVAQGAEPLVYRAPWRKTVGQKPPGTSCP